MMNISSPVYNSFSITVVWPIINTCFNIRVLHSSPSLFWLRAVALNLIMEKWSPIVLRLVMWKHVRVPCAASVTVIFLRVCNCSDRVFHFIICCRVTSLYLTFWWWRLWIWDICNNILSALSVAKQHYSMSSKLILLCNYLIGRACLMCHWTKYHVPLSYSTYSKFSKFSRTEWKNIYSYQVTYGICFLNKCNVKSSYSIQQWKWRVVPKKNICLAPRVCCWLIVQNHLSYFMTMTNNYLLLFVLICMFMQLNAAFILF